jgi:hypothetical protein
MRWALIVASLIPTPYRSIGSRSPRSSEPTADTASDTDPPYVAARSAPRVMSLSVLTADSDCD